MFRCNLNETDGEKTTPRMGYTRIYLVSGRPLAFVGSLDVIQRQGAIRNNNVLTQREDSEGLICLCPSPHTTSRNKKKAAIPSPKTNIEKKRNKKRFFLSPQKFSRSEKKKDGVGLPLASPDMLYKERTPKTNLRGSQSGGYLLSHNAVQICTRCAGEIIVPLS